MVLGSHVATISNQAFEDCKNLKSVTLSNGVTIIGAESFANCRNLNSINFPKSVTTIGYRAFLDCGLTSITLPENLANLGTLSFKGCPLKSVTIYCSRIGDWFEDYFPSIQEIILGAEVRNIGAAFTDCPSLMDLYCYSEIVPETHKAAFAYTPFRIATLHVPASAIEAYKAASITWSYFGSIVAIEE